MKAIIVPGITDLNKGDQALVWESFHLIEDVGSFDKILIMESGDTEDEKNMLCSQTKERGFPILENILLHPRRGKHDDTNYIGDSKRETLRLIKNAISDFIKYKTLLLVCNHSFVVKLLFSNQVNNTIKTFKKTDAIFVKGGGFIHAHGEKTAPYVIWYLLFYVRLAKKLNKKVIFFPNSFGPFEGVSVKKQIRKVFNGIDLIYARENVSAQSLGELLKTRIPVEMDLGFFLKPAKKEAALKILEKYNLSGADKIIGITVRPWRFPGALNPNKQYKDYIKSVAEFMKYVVEKGYKVAICNQSIGPNSHEDDRNAIRDLLKEYNHSNIVWINENLTCDLLKAVYSQFYFFVGTRFHSIIFSLTSLVPSIAIGYGGNKSKGIMSDIDLDDYVLQIEDTSPKRLIEKFDQGIDEYNNIKSKLHKLLDISSQSRQRLIDDIKSLYKH